MSLDEKLNRLAARYDEINALLASDPKEDRVRLSKELSELEPIVDLVRTHRRVRSLLVETQAMLSEPEMKSLAEEECRRLSQMLDELTQAIKVALLPKDEADARNVILEVRAGTGGEEASLFAGELFRMYERYAALKGWTFEVMSFSETDLGGAKEAAARIVGRNVFGRLKFESGVHRVQRVPETESGGRIHTSAATVAVLPEAEEVDVRIEEKDLLFDTYRSQGAGGQHVNTTDSAVRITHLPTGIVVACQEERSQHKNRTKALAMLRTKIFDVQRQKIDSERAADRRTQVGTGDRSERIRTYNFPQGRITDHRINLTLYKLESMMQGASLDEIVDALSAEEQAARLAELG